MNNTIAISSDFLTAFAALPRQVQGKVTDFINKFRNNPAAPGINYEKINNTADSKICSVRIDDTYRGIVAREKESGVYLLLWVDHHDEAYDWAKRKKCAINPSTGSVQVFDIQEVSEPIPSVIEDFGLFAEISDTDLLALGVPEEQLAFVKGIPREEVFYQSKSAFPVDAYENLEWLINGFSVEEVLDLYRASLGDNVQTGDMAEALHKPESRSAFVIVEGEDELRKIMSEPLEKWRVFLHPSQRKIVEKVYSGPARVLGGAGTGKTVVAMHRAKWLSSQMKGKGRILFTTFTANLAADIKDSLRKICSLDQQRRIDVINLDAWVSQFLREHGYPNAIVYDNVLDGVWEEAVALSGEDLGLPVSFFSEEWAKVVATQETFTLEAYAKASRLGRGTSLDRKKRLQVWHVFEEYKNLLKERHIRDMDTALFECRLLIEKEGPASQYQSIIVDEGQDFSMSAYRLLRALAGKEHTNDMFIVGDSHQRIYKKKVTLSKCGVNVRGRSNLLKINYRTTEEIRKYAFALLKGIDFDDLDDDYDDGRICQSLTHGTAPKINLFSGAAEELDYLVGTLKDMEAQGVPLKDICIVARTHPLLDGYIAGLTARGIRTYEIRRSKLDDPGYDGVRMATMHRVKGLEFRHVFVVAANRNVLPLSSAIIYTDAIAERESIAAERCLLYVALTRAQESAQICSYGQQSEFLPS